MITEMYVDTVRRIKYNILVSYTTLKVSDSLPFSNDHMILLNDRDINKDILPAIHPVPSLGNKPVNDVLIYWDI